MVRPTLVAALALLVACGGDSSVAPAGDDALLSVQPEVLISTSDAPTSDPYTFAGRAFTRGDALYVTVQYGGGCARHQFSLHASHVFMESNPVQAGLAIRHNANGDMCRALLTRDLRFDLTRLKHAWQKSYQQRHGTIILVLRGYPARIRYDF